MKKTVENFVAKHLLRKQRKRTTVLKRLEHYWRILESCPVLQISNFLFRLKFTSMYFKKFCVGLYGFSLLSNYVYTTSVWYPT